MPTFPRTLTLAALSFAATAPLHAQTSRSVAHVVITGGPKAGTYDADNGAHGGCTTGASGKGSFGIQLGNPKGAPDKFNSVQMIVPAPSAAGSSQFLLQVGFGSLMNRTKQYTIETRTGEKQAGKGSVTVKDGGAASASVTFDATTADGVRIAGTVTCTGVIRM